MKIIINNIKTWKVTDWPVALYLCITVVIPWIIIISYIIINFVFPTLNSVWVKLIKFVLALLY